MDRYRTHFPHLERMLFLNHASETPVSLPVRERIDQYLNSAMDDPDAAPIEVARYKALLGRLINASSDEIAVMPNTATGIATVALGLDWRPGDNLVVPEQEYPANVRPWLPLADRGVEIRRVPVDPDGRIRLESFAARIDGRTRVVAVSHVEFLTGFRNDLKAIGSLAHQAGALFVVDAIQSLGAVPVDVDRDGSIDVLAAGGYKWLMGPVGTGFLYVRRSRQAQISPSLIGSRSTVAGTADIEGDSPLLPTAQRYETGCMAWSLFHGWSAALEMLLEVGADRIEQHLLELTGYLIAGLRERGYDVVTPEAREQRAGIVSFAAGDHDSTVAVERRLYQQKVVVAHRGPFLRVSPHFYNNQQDLQRFLDTLGRRS